MSTPKEKCNCCMKIDDVFFDLPCPIHDKDDNKLTREERQRSIKRLLAHAKSLNW